MSNYFMTDAFHTDAVKAVREAVAEADALGLPKAYSDGPELPEQPVIINMADIRRAMSVWDAMTDEERATALRTGNTAFPAKVMQKLGFKIPAELPSYDGVCDTPNHN